MKDEHSLIKGMHEEYYYIIILTISSTFLSPLVYFLFWIPSLVCIWLYVSVYLCNKTLLKTRNCPASTKFIANYTILIYFFIHFFPIKCPAWGGCSSVFYLYYTYNLDDNLFIPNVHILRNLSEKPVLGKIALSLKYINAVISVY